MRHIDTRRPAWPPRPDGHPCSAPAGRDLPDVDDAPVPFFAHLEHQLLDALDRAAADDHRSR